jgi:hypothetical protein
MSRLQAEGKRELGLLQDVASKRGLMILLYSADVFLPATTFVGLSMCSSLVAIGFGTSY